MRDEDSRLPPRPEVDLADPGQVSPWTAATGVNTLGVTLTFEQEARLLEHVEAAADHPARLSLLITAFSPLASAVTGWVANGADGHASPHVVPDFWFGQVRAVFVPPVPPNLAGRRPQPGAATYRRLCGELGVAADAAGVRQGQTLRVLRRHSAADAAGLYAVEVA